MISADLSTSLRLCFVEARALRYETISLEQLLLALLHNPPAARVLRACSVDIDGLHSCLTANILENTPVRVERVAAVPQPSPEVQRAVERAIARVLSTRGRMPFSNRLGRTAWHAAARVLAFMRVPWGGFVNGADVLVSVLAENESFAAKELQRHGATRFDVTNYLAHGIKKSELAKPLVTQRQARGRMDVVLVNDDFTPMEFVVKVLQDHFMLDSESAERVMLRIHSEGRFVCGRFDDDVAVSKMELVRAAALREQHPLRCVVVAAR